MNCTLITPRVHDFIRRARPSRILHIFDEVINLVNDRGEVASLSTINIGPGPFTMIVNGDFPTNFQMIKLQDTVKLEPETVSITIGRLHIETLQAPVWDPKPAWGQLKHASLKSDQSEQSLAAEIDSHLQLLITAVSTNNFIAGHQATTALAGLGQGLTPTGDDILVGILYAFWVWDPKSKWIDLITDWAVPLTTTLSAAYLRAACRGETTLHWHNLVAGDPDAVNQILSIGHTSGQDAWTGFTTAHKTLQKKLTHQL